MLLERKKPDVDVVGMLCSYLDKGYTYQELHNAITESWKCHQPFPHYKFKNKASQVNLVKQGTMYYHKQLKLMNSLPVITHDIDSGTITSSTQEFYVEGVASYTMNDLLTYFYSKNMADEQEYSPKRMAGFFKFSIDKYGIDKVLFMIEAAARMYDAEKKVFTIDSFESYSSTASQYLEEIKNNCKYSGGDKYVYRKRVLFS